VCTGPGTCAPQAGPPPMGGPPGPTGGPQLIGPPQQPQQQGWLAPGPTMMGGQPGMNQMPLGPADTGWARTGGYVGITATVLLGIAGIGLAATEGDTDAGLGIGIAATLAGGVMIPVTAAGGGSARSNPSVLGAPGLRLAGWIAYGLALADALVLIGLNVAEVYVSAAVGISVAVLGMASAIGMSIDAFASASQAESAGGGEMQSIGAAPRLVPIFGLRPGPDGSVTGLVGVGGVL